MESPESPTGSCAALLASLDLYAANFDLMLETPRPAVRKRARLAFRQLQTAMNARSSGQIEDMTGVLLALGQAHSRAITLRVTARGASTQSRWNRCANFSGVLTHQADASGWSCASRVPCSLRH